MLGIFSRSFCVTATRTVMTDAAGPVILILTITPSLLSSFRPPPPRAHEVRADLVQHLHRPREQAKQALQ